MVKSPCRPVARQFGVQDPQVPIVTWTCGKPWEDQREKLGKIGKSMGFDGKSSKTCGENGKFMENPWENVGKHVGNGANILETYEKNVGKYWKSVGKMCKTSWTFMCKHTGKAKTRKIWNVSGRFEHFLFFTQWVCLKNRGPKNVTIDQNLPLQNCHKLRDPTNFEIPPN
jgi:hypothetical protein